jgi:hypothetical protein
MIFAVTEPGVEAEPVEHGDVDDEPEAADDKESRNLAGGGSDPRPGRDGYRHRAILRGI